MGGIGNGTAKGSTLGLRTAAEAGRRPTGTESAPSGNASPAPAIAPIFNKCLRVIFNAFRSPSFAVARGSRVGCTPARRAEDTAGWGMAASAEGWVRWFRGWFIRRFGRRLGQEFELSRPRDGFGAVPDLELVVDGVHGGLCGADGDKEVAGDLGVGPARGQEGQDFELPLAQGSGGGARCSAVRLVDRRWGWQLARVPLREGVGPDALLDP